MVIVIQHTRWIDRHTHIYVRIIRCNSHKMLPQKNIWLVWYFSLEDIWAMTVWCEWYSMEEHIMKLMRRNNFTFTYLTLIRLAQSHLDSLIFYLIFHFFFLLQIALISHTILPNQRLHLIFLCFFLCSLQKYRHSFWQSWFQIIT